MKGPLLILWACLSIFVFIALWVAGLSLPAMAVLVVNLVIGSVIASSAPAPPPKLAEGDVEPGPSTGQGGTLAPKAERQNSSHGSITVSHLGHREYDDKQSLVLHIDGEAKGEIGEKPAHVPISLGRHSIFVQAFFRPPKYMPGGKAWAAMMNTTLQAKSSEITVNIVSGVRTEVICKRESNGMGSPKLILFVKEQAAEEAKAVEKSQMPKSKQCPSCSGEVKSTAQSCKFCGHAFEGVPA